MALKVVASTTERPATADLRPSQDIQRPNGMSELELLRSITSGFTSFGNAVRLSGLSDLQKSRVLAHLAEASSRVMDATNAYLFELGQARRDAAQRDAAARPAEAPAVQLVAG